MSESLVTSINNTIEVLKEQPQNNAIYKYDDNLIKETKDKLKQRLPQLEEVKLQCLSIITQNLDLTRLSNADLLTIANSGLQYLEYQGNTPEVGRILDPDNPAFDFNGVILSNDFNRQEIREKHKQSLALNKSLNAAFIANYITNLG